MKTFNKVAAQGDVMFMRIDRLPSNAVKAEREKKTHIVVTHSETGHHHVLESETAELYRLPDSIMDCFLVVKDPSVLEHHRPHDTHESILFEPGVYHVRRQRESTPEGWRAVAD